MYSILLCSSDNRGGTKRRDKEIRKQPSGDPSSGGIPGFCCSAGIPPLLGSPLGCFLISLSRRFVPPRLSDEHRTREDALEYRDHLDLGEQHGRQRLLDVMDPLRLVLSSVRATKPRGTNPEYYSCA